MLSGRGHGPAPASLPATGAHAATMGDSIALTSSSQGLETMPIPSFSSKQMQCFLALLDSSPPFGTLIGKLSTPNVTCLIDRGVSNHMSSNVALLSDLCIISLVQVGLPHGGQINATITLVPDSCFATSLRSSVGSESNGCRLFGLFCIIFS